MGPMQEAMFAVYILMHVVFTPIDGQDHRTVKYKANIMSVGLNSQQCVDSVKALYTTDNYDLKTNSFGCIRVVHP